MENDGSISNATDSIVGLLQQSGVPNNDLSSLSNDTNSAKQETVEQAPVETEEELDTTQPQSEVAVVDESADTREDSIEQQSEEPHLETTEIPEEPTEQTYTVKVQGETFDVNLDELKAGYQRESDYRRKTESLSIEKQQHQEQLGKDNSIVTDKLNNLEKLTSMARQQLQLDAGDLNELMQRDPVEGMRKKHALEQRAMQLQAQDQEASKIRNEEMQKVLKEEERKMYLEIPEMRDAGQKAQFVNNMRTYLTGMGFNDNEVNNVNDHRYVKLIRDGMKWNALQKSNPRVSKKVQGTPKVVKGGVALSKGARNRKLSNDKMARLKKSGSLDDATEMLKDIFNG